MLRINKRRMYISTFCTLLFYWLLIKKRKYTEKFEAIVDIEPIIAWEFSADFSNQQRINPTILNFEIEYEKGNYDNWEYSVVYKEYSITFPFVHYENRGIFRVMPQVRKQLAISKHYRILQDFSSCILGYCLQTDAEILFMPSGDDNTKIEEHVTFECPPIISSLCFRDLRLQKEQIFDNIASAVYTMRE